MKKGWLKYKRYTLALQLLPIPRKVISAILDDCQVFFVLSTGRTGTKWLSEVLSLVKDGYIAHEPIPVETYAHLQAVNSQAEAEKYIKTVKCRDIFIKVLRNKCEIYGEVNGILRRHIPFLKIYFPNARLLHLVRDGRSVVRSLLARKTYEGSHSVYSSKCPLPSKEMSQKWGVMSEFEKACWAWKEENEQMRRQIPNLARLEDITSNYKAFQAQVLKPLGLFVSEADWMKYAKTKINESKLNKTRLNEEWTEEQEKIFEAICGEEMKALGY